VPTPEMFEMATLEQEVRDITAELRKQMNDLTMRMFLRTTVCFKDLGFITGKD